jgi:hypothetical protein
MIDSRIQIIAVTASVLVVLMVIHLIRRRRLRMEYSFVWLLGSAVLILFSLWRDLLEIIADFIGVYYSPAILLLVAIFAAALGFLHFSVAMSKQTDDNKRLVQEVALLRRRL